MMMTMIMMMMIIIIIIVVNALSLDFDEPMMGSAVLGICL